MEKLAKIWHHFRPTQPDWNEAEGVVYEEVAPEPALRSAIWCYWQLGASDATTHVTYHAVADGCIDLFFDLDRPEEAFVMGFCDAYAAFPLETPFRYVGVRFLPTMFPVFFRLPASSLTGRVEALADVAPSTAAFIRDHIRPGTDFAEVKRLLDDHFGALYRGLTWNPDNRLYNALEKIVRTPEVRIETEIETGVSPRQLRRLFDTHIGAGAKTFANVVRFQHYIREASMQKASATTPHFFDYGYYDQSHFIKEFKRFYGRTPSAVR